MRVKDIDRKGRCPVSFEIFPPKGELSVDSLRGMLEGLKNLSPEYISVTCSAGGTGNSGRTAELSGVIEQEYGVPAVAHITCLNSGKSEVDAMCTDIYSRGVRNVLALRGDPVEGCAPTDFHYANELIEYLKNTTDFCIGAGCYPEGHVACKSLEDDIRYLKRKQDAGADFFISQLFFDNDTFYRFIDKARSAGVTRPIDAGIMPIMGKSQITRMIFMCGASLPAAVVRMFYKYENSPEDLKKAGMDYSAEQMEDLARSGAADGIHIYAMNKADVARYEVEALINAGIRL